MRELRDFAFGMLERHGAVVEVLEPDELEVLAPEPLRRVMGWPELARLGFGGQRRDQAIRIGLEGDCLDRFGGLLGGHGRWAERQLTLPGRPLNDPERVLDRALDLPNAVWRLQDVTATFTRCLMLAFRYTALSDEKRDGLIWLGFNLGTGAAIDDILARLRPILMQEAGWEVPEPAVRAAAGPGWDGALLDARLRPLLEHRVRKELEPFLRAMRRRLERDCNRVHAYHDELRAASLKRLSALARSEAEKAQADRRREAMRVAAIEREHQSKLDDLRRNYALRVSVEWIQALELYLPVQRLAVLIRRRKGERLIRLDWHPLARLAEPAPCDCGPGLDRVRLICDEQLHLTEPAGQAPCPSCARSWCRACHPGACPRCGHAGERSRPPAL
jgi:hypothetical protein